MGQFIDWVDKLKRYYSFTPSEVKGVIIAILVLAFIISFREWGKEGQFSAAIGLFNFFNAVLIVAFSMLIHISVQRMWSLATGHRVEWRMWSFGLLLGLIFAFLSNGRIWLLLPGGIIIHHLAGHRLGWFRYDINFWALALIAVTGCYATITLAAIMKGISGIVSTSLLQKAIAFNVAYALYSMIPIPPLDGARTFYGSRMLYAFSVFGIVSAAILLHMNISVILAAIFSFIIAVVLWISYYIVFEDKAWNP